jgi:hypothetical protein
LVKKRKNTQPTNDESEDLQSQVLFINLLEFNQTCLDSAKAVANFGNARGTLGHADEEFGRAKCSIRFGLQAKGRGDGRSERRNSIEYHKFPNLMLY